MVETREPPAVRTLVSRWLRLAAALLGMVHASCAAPVQQTPPRVRISDARTSDGESLAPRQLRGGNDEAESERDTSSKSEAGSDDDTPGPAAGESAGESAAPESPAADSGASKLPGEEQSDGDGDEEVVEIEIEPDDPDSEELEPSM